MQRYPFTFLAFLVILASCPAVGILLNFVLVIDAGSSGSRIHCHTYVVKNGVPVFDVSSKRKKVKPGLNAFQDTPAESKRTIEELLGWAQSEIPEQSWDSTPVYLKATAGLRSVPEDVANHILRHCRDAIHESPFHFRDGFARIISGKEEGIFGWITANYLEGYLYPDPSSSTEEGPPKPSSGPVGVVEMGGYSLQITYSPEHDQIERDELSKFEINGQTHYLYTHSYMGFGLEAAQDELYEKADFASTGKSTPHPCYPRGYNYQDVPGSGDFQKCFEVMDHIFEGCMTPPCLNDGHPSHPAIGNEQFYAIENFYYTTQFFELKSDENLTLMLEKRGGEFCDTEWEQLLKKYPDEPMNDLYKYCFSAVYIIRLLTALGFEDPIKNIRVQQSVNNADIDWALGSVIYEISEELSKQRSSSHGVSFLLFSDTSDTSTIENEQVWRNLTFCGTVVVLVVLLYVWRTNGSLFNHPKKDFSGGLTSAEATPISSPTCVAGMEK